MLPKIKALWSYRYWFLSFLVLVLSLLALRSLNAWHDDWKLSLRSPIQNFVVIEPVEKNLITYKPAILSTIGARALNKPSAEEVADKIHGLESSWGKNDTCAGHGVNGYGFRQNKTENKCFRSQDAVRYLVLSWIAERRAEGLSDAELLCFYNTGFRQSDCPYYRNYLKL